VEQALVRLFAEGRIPGFIPSYICEEASAVGVCSALPADSYVTSTYRGHGHIPAKAGALHPFFAELYGKASGYCRRKGGSMHVTDLDLGILGANVIVGTGIPIATGAALASRLQSLDRVAVAFFGDGATDIGVFHEALNMASLWQLHAIFVSENNGFAEFIAQSAHQRIERISDRAAAYAMPGVMVDGNDVEAVHAATAEALSLRGQAAGARSSNG
jgi:acetoin:2,6-dichlorophenolindophenol oxidoreductase subunit alpha